MKKTALLTAALALGLAVNAHASPVSYTIVDFGATRIDIDTRIDLGDGETVRIDPNFNGVFLKAGTILGEHIYINGSYRSTRNKDLQDEFDLRLGIDQWDVAIGMRYGLNASTDLVAEIGYINTDFRLRYFDPDAERHQRVGSSADDIRLTVGVRSMLAHNIEGEARVGWYDGDLFDSKFRGVLGATWYLNQTWGVGLSADFGSDIRIYNLGFRANY